ncbi:MAG: RNA pseudouridine synthase [Parachlamydiaceae bacterium]|nr:RNA pseudouridine synthase [Parachlamydiaceae bacterium]
MLEVLYVDNHILLVNKPAGLATQPSPTSDESLESLCKEWVKEQYKKPGNVFLHAIHRLDKPVSGIVLFARTSKALSRLNESMREHEMQKVYIALVEGHLKDSEGRLEHYLVHGDHIAHLGTEKTAGAKRASLKYIVKERKGDCSLLEITLETGRYHQIRAQMAAIGHPVVGDTKYGSFKVYPNQGIALCHARFSFPHPISKEQHSYALANTF